jgi:hypothetical protein
MPVDLFRKQIKGPIVIHIKHMNRRQQMCKHVKTHSTWSIDPHTRRGGSPAMRGGWLTHFVGRPTCHGGPTIFAASCTFLRSTPLILRWFKVSLSTVAEGVDADRWCGADLLPTPSHPIKGPLTISRRPLWSIRILIHLGSIQRREELPQTIQWLWSSFILCS